MYVDMHKRITFGPYVINLATFRRVFFSGTLLMKLFTKYVVK